MTVAFHWVISQGLAILLLVFLEGQQKEVKGLMVSTCGRRWCQEDSKIKCFSDSQTGLQEWLKLEQQ